VSGERKSNGRIDTQARSRSKSIFQM